MPNAKKKKKSLQISVGKEKKKRESEKEMSSKEVICDIEVYQYFIIVESKIFVVFTNKFFGRTLVEF